MTMGKPLLMGRKTWESLPRKPLPGRRNIVITRQAGYRAPGAEIASSVDEALTLAAENAPEEIAVIGGAEIFCRLLPQAHRLYLTEIDLTVDGDVFIPRSIYSIARDPKGGWEWTTSAISSSRPD